MNRLKFLVFAVIALGVFAWGLSLAPTLGADRSVKDASLTLAGAPAAAALKLEGLRSELQAAGLRLAASTALSNPGPRATKPELPTVERFNAVRAAASEGLPAALKPLLVVSVSNEAGALVAQGPADPVSAPEGFDFGAVDKAGGAGALVTTFGAQHLYFSFPLVVSDKNEVKAIGSAAVGLPLLVDARTFASSVRGELGLSAVALVSEGKVISADGDKGAIDRALKTLKAGPVAALNEGSIASLGPLELPLMSSLTQQLGVRRAIAGTPFEVIAVASSSEDLYALAGFQKFGVGALAGLFLLSLVVVALLRSGEEEGAAMVLPPPMPAPPPRPVEAPVSLAQLPHPPAQEASPDDFDFPQSPAEAAPASPRTAQAPALQRPEPEAPPEPAIDPFASLAPAPAARAAPVPQAPAYPASKPPPPISTSQAPAFQAAPPPPPAPVPAAQARPPQGPPPTNPFEEEEGGRTMAYPVFKAPKSAAPAPPPAGMDPFAMAAAQLSPDEQGQEEGDYNPDATRVAAVPAELIKAARQSTSGMTGERPSLASKPIAAAAPKVTSVVSGASGPLDEERHFQDVFREFVATREKCGEPADGLTYDKFKAKLLKNKEQLVQKYNCKSVRFQVYVKDAKAALKATPVKD